MKIIEKQPNNSIIRDIKLEELETIYDIEIKCFKEPYTKAILKFFIKTPYCLSILIEKEETIIGYAMGLLKYNYHGHIASIAVLPRYRNLGYGEKLLAQLLELFKDHNKAFIQLEVRISNEYALKMYKKFGFKISKIKKAYYNNNEDAYLMKLALVNE